MKVKAYIPNLLTLTNMTAGILSVYFSMTGKLSLAAQLILIAAVFDFLDGFAARMLNAYSEIGKQLDSLADLISFGLAPGFILFNMINISHGKPGVTAEETGLMPFIAFIIPLFSALRLAKFNIDDSQTTSFSGMPTPAMAILIASYPLIRELLYADRGLFYMVFTNSYFLSSNAIILSLLMVIPLPMFAFKFKNYSWTDNKVKYVFLLFSIILLLSIQWIAIPLIIASYILLSLIFYLADIQS